MRVLVVEGTPGAAAPATEALRAAGHDTASCHDGPGTLCNGLVTIAGCPLDHTPVDAALLVRSEPNAHPTPTEGGARCALRRHVPLAVTGTVDSNPYEALAAVVSPDPSDPVGLVERAAHSPLSTHTTVAVEAFRRVLTAEGLDPSAASATVTRDGNTLSVVLDPGIALTPMQVEVASVRTLGAVRAFDREATIIDVALAKGLPVLD